MNGEPVYYYVRAHAPRNALWNSLPTSWAEKVQAEGGDLERLDWEPAEVDPDLVLDMALRFGVPTTSGLAVSASHIAQVTRARELRRLLAQREETVNSEAYRAAVSRVDAYMGEEYAEYGRQVEAAANESHHEHIAEADEEAAELYRHPLNGDLVAHWTSLGGILPPAATLE